MYIASRERARPRKAGDVGGTAPRPRSAHGQGNDRQTGARSCRMVAGGPESGKTGRREMVGGRGTVPARALGWMVLAMTSLGLPGAAGAVCARSGPFALVPAGSGSVVAWRLTRGGEPFFVKGVAGPNQSRPAGGLAEFVSPYGASASAAMGGNALKPTAAMSGSAPMAWRQGDQQHRQHRRADLRLVPLRRRARGCRGQRQRRSDPAAPERGTDHPARGARRGQLSAVGGGARSGRACRHRNPCPSLTAMPRMSPAPSG